MKSISRQILQLEVPERRAELKLEVGDMIAIPDNVWVFDKETRKMLQMTEVHIDKATTIVLVPKVAGG